ncbi:MAG TPA: hypothetical protein VGK67_01365 [Myxococcales bacterium]|jgi:hypothetical protein
MATRNLKLDGSLSLLKLGGECAGLNLLVAVLAVAGAQVGTWLADVEGSGVGLAAGLFVGLVGQAFGVEAIAARQSRR